jgi:Uma2 family endonuclease
VAIPDGPDGEPEAYVPDLVVIDRAAMSAPDRWKFDTESVHLVVEVVSRSLRSRQDDRVRKAVGYASAHVPLYLVVDPLRNEVTLFSKPENKAYRAKTCVPVGDKIHFPEPFDGVLDTSVFIP